MNIQKNIGWEPREGASTSRYYEHYLKKFLVSRGRTCIVDNQRDLFSIQLDIGVDLTIGDQDVFKIIEKELQSLMLATPSDREVLEQKFYADMISMAKISAEELVALLSNQYQRGLQEGREEVQSAVKNVLGITC